jgi:FkbM family methyltransferase
MGKVTIKGIIKKFFLNPIRRRATLRRDSRKKKRFYSKLLKGREGLIFDIGAHKGDYVLAFLRNNFNVIAVEPQPLLFKQLEERFGNNDKITMIQKAVSDKVGDKISLFVCDQGDTWSTCSSTFKNRREHYLSFSEEIKVETTTLNNLIETYGEPVFIKIDVEGFELVVLSGLTKQIQQLSFEFHADLMDEGLKCIKYLNDLDNKAIFNLNLGLNYKLQFDDWLSYSDFVNEFKNMPKIATHDKFYGDVYVRFSKYNEK